MRALPLPSRFRWTFNNSHEANEVPSNKYKSNGTLSRLNYRAESEKDFGVVHCWAANVLGETTKPCIFTLIPAGKTFKDNPLYWGTHLAAFNFKELYFQIIQLEASKIQRP